MDQEEITKGKGWFLIDHYDLLDTSLVLLVEVSPENDIKDHITSEDCECIPTLERTIEGLPLLIHNAFDGREDCTTYERGH